MKTNNSNNLNRTHLTLEEKLHQINSKIWRASFKLNQTKLMYRIQIFQFRKSHFHKHSMCPFWISQATKAIKRKCSTILGLTAILTIAMYSAHTFRKSQQKSKTNRKVLHQLEWKTCCIQNKIKMLSAILRVKQTRDLRSQK